MQKIPIHIFDLLTLHRKNPKRYPFLLESSMHLTKDKNYSLLLAHPQKNIVLNHIDEFDFLEKMNKALKKVSYCGDLPFIGGWFIYLSYEFSQQIEPSLMLKTSNLKTPLAYAVEIPSAIIIKHHTNEAFIVDEEGDKKRINNILSDISALNQFKIKQNKAISATLINSDRNIFMQQVRVIKSYIKEGDVFQVNLSRYWQLLLNTNTNVADIYQRLRIYNPAPFSALIRYANFEIISSSPERLFRKRKSIIETRPIAGTHPRGDNGKDYHLKQSLITHPKERSEHIMLLDLERNDLGKICAYGSVSIDEMMMVESYASVHHIVSNIKGNIRKNKHFSDIIRALFPGGTITGCPKVRAMEIIAELENTARGAYTGSIGYVSHHGYMDFNILIRTFVKQGRKLNFRAGAGIVFDSNATREADETEHKIAALLKIFELSCEKNK